MEKEILPQTIGESQILLEEVETFMKSPTYEAWKEDLKDEIAFGTSNVTKALPMSIGEFLLREQGFGAIQNKKESLDWFKDRAQAIRDHIKAIAARSNEPIKPQTNE